MRSVYNSWIARRDNTRGSWRFEQDSVRPPFELTEEEIDKELPGSPGTWTSVTTSCSATPAIRALDAVGEGHVGSQSIRKHMTRFDLVCCAHIHEARGITEVDGVTVVNPGPASEGYGAIIRFGKEPKDIHIELIAV